MGKLGYNKSEVRKTMKKVYYIKSGDMYMSADLVGHSFRNIRDMGEELSPDLLARRNGVGCSRVIGGYVKREWDCVYGRAVEYVLR